MEIPAPGPDTQQQTVCEDCGRSWIVECNKQDVNLCLDNEKLEEIKRPSIFLTILREAIPIDPLGTIASLNSPALLTCIVMGAKDKFLDRWKVSHKGLGLPAYSGCKIVPVSFRQDIKIEDSQTSGNSDKNLTTFKPLKRKRKKVLIDISLPIAETIQALPEMSQSHVNMLTPITELTEVSNNGTGNNIQFSSNTSTTSNDPQPDPQPIPPLLNPPLPNNSHFMNYQDGVTYVLKKGFSQRGGDKLYDNHGYTYTKKRGHFKTDDKELWRCTKRHCTARVVQTGLSFIAELYEHNHSGMPEKEKHDELVKKAQEQCKVDISTSASTIVKGVFLTDVQHESPSHSHPLPANLIRSCNYHRKKGRLV